MFIITGELQMQCSGRRQSSSDAGWQHLDAWSTCMHRHTQTHI